MSARRAAAPLWGYLTSEAVSLTGTRVSMIAIPWLVLTTTGSAVQTGLVAFAEWRPTSCSRRLAGPWTDRLGARRVCVSADLAAWASSARCRCSTASGCSPSRSCSSSWRWPAPSAAPVTAPGTRSCPPWWRRPASLSSGRPGLSGAVERLASTLGAAFAGVLVAAVGPASALLLDAASFGVSAVLLVLTVPRSRRRRRRP